MGLKDKEEVGVWGNLKGGVFFLEGGGYVMMGFIRMDLRIYIYHIC